ncbi:MAG: helix-turn-helix transcriptional regulator [Alistipes sp.]|nr:helix-turn-helix transcriptional regulator [Alistipes sp.]
MRGAKMKNSIRVARAERRMTQQQLADAVGVSRQTVNAIESGRFIPSTVLALKVARLFEKPVEEMFSLEEGD